MKCDKSAQLAGVLIEYVVSDPISTSTLPGTDQLETVANSIEDKFTLTL